MKHGSAAARLLGLWVRIPLGRGYLSLVIVVCCQEEVSTSGSSLVQRSPTECDMPECDGEASTMRRPWPTGGFGRVWAHHQEVQPYVYSNWYLLFFLDDCVLSWLDWTTDSHLKAIISTNCCSTI
jgi:hypothetical protein